MAPWAPLYAQALDCSRGYVLRRGGVALQVGGWAGFLQRFRTYVRIHRGGGKWVGSLNRGPQSAEVVTCADVSCRDHRLSLDPSYTD